MATSLHQAVADCDIAGAQSKKENRNTDEDDIEHGGLLLSTIENPA
jgi:hypothetical protein